MRTYWHILNLGIQNTLCYRINFLTRTVFNLVPIDSALEGALVEFLDQADDVAAYAKNTKKLGLTVDYQSAKGHFRLYEPDFEFVVVPFDQIEDFVLQGKADAGLLIHEGQLTYADNGLKKIVDLGEWWAERTGGRAK